MTTQTTMRKTEEDLETGKVYAQKLDVTPKSYNKEERTVEVVWTTGSRVDRGAYAMELSLNDKDVNLSRLKNGAPVLDNHDSGGMFGPAKGVHGRSLGQIGVVEDAWFEGRGATRKGIAKLRFSSRAEVDPVLADIENGVIRHVSVGFSIEEYEEVDRITNETRDVPVYMATKWTPVEISPVQAGADDAAVIRSISPGLHNTADNTNAERFEEKVETLVNAASDKVIEQLSQQLEPLAQRKEELDNNNPEMDTNTNPSKIVTEKEERVMEKDEKTLQAEAVKAERQRAKDITEAVEKAGLERSFADDMIESEVSIEDARKAIIDKMAERNAEQKTQTRVEVGTDHSRDHVLKGLSNAWLHRGMPGQYKLDDHGRNFAGLSLVRSAAAFLETLHGEKTRYMSNMEIVQRALSTSDFPELLADTMNKSLRDSYAEAPQTFSPFVRTVSVSDFKQISRTNYGDAPSLEEVQEHGAVKLGKISEDAEKYNVKTYAKKLRMTRKMLINDDLDAFVRTPAKFGRSARSKESDLVWDILTQNSGNGENMSDGNPLFDASHNNISVAAALAVDPIGDMLAKLRLQQGLDGEKITLSGQYLIGPVALEAKARQFFGATDPGQDSSVNPFKSQLTWISEPRLDDVSATRYYVAAGADQIDSIEIAYLDGSNGQPMIETRNMGGVEGIEVEAIHDFGVKAIDYRGFVKNDGA